MTRRVAAVLVALTIFPAVLYAQDTALTVTVQSADVYKAPSTGAPVLGHAARGAVLPVVRNLGSWVQIAWDGSPDGIGYVHTTMGRVNAPTTNAPATNAATTNAAGASAQPRARTTTASSSASSSASVSASAPGAVPLATQRTTGVPPSGQQGTTISHIVGVGGMVGSMSSFGATARWWRDKHLGVQVGLTRDGMSSDTAAGRVTSMQI